MNPQIIRWIKIVVMKTLKEKNLMRLDVQTLISAGMLGYAQSVRRFDPKREVKFKTFAEHRIKGAVLDEVRKMIGDERCKTKRPISVEYDFAQMSDEGWTMKNLESQMDFDLFLQKVALDEGEKVFLLHRVSGMSLREISLALGYSESKASQILAKIKRVVYLWYKEEMDIKFTLITHSCPVCAGASAIADHISVFRCDYCDVDLQILEGIPILAVTDSFEE